MASNNEGVWQISVFDLGGNLLAEYGGLDPNDEGGTKYYISDWQGSVRAIVNQSGFVVSRTDYQAFGEKINAGIGGRTVGQGFGSYFDSKIGYAMTKSDQATGLNHSNWRKQNGQSGRWTSPDPYSGSMNLLNPQSFNRYSYVINDPIGFVDPSGLDLECIVTTISILDITTETYDYIENWRCEEVRSPGSGGGPAPTGRGGGGTKPPPKKCEAQLTGNATVDKTAQYLFAESSEGNVREVLAIGIVFLNRYALNTRRFGCQDWNKILSKGSTADTEGSQFAKAGSNSSIQNLAPGDCQGYIVAQAAAQVVVDSMDESRMKKGVETGRETKILREVTYCGSLVG
ncbi:MAG: hypothetical protein OEQ28_16310 [Acidobacteriota bacterium]|nr:hypothetical protein [Acidobacteriota bacterium]